MLNDGGQPFHSYLVNLASLSQQVEPVLHKGTADYLFNLLGFEGRVKEVDIDLIQVFFLKTLVPQLDGHV
jgi:hypothetical protein